MTLALALLPGLLVLVVTCPRSSHGFPDEENIEVSGLEASGLEEQLDPSGAFCQRDKNPKGLGFIGVKYDLLKGNPEGKTSLGGADPGFELTRKILKLTTNDGEVVPEQICFEGRDSKVTEKSNRVFGGTKRYQEKLNLDVKAEGTSCKL